jgi:hypothetical protein
MRKFECLEDAFAWWLKAIYPGLPRHVKDGRYRNAWRDFTYKKGISRKRMKDILSEFAEVYEQTIIVVKLK